MSPVPRPLRLLLVSDRPELVLRFRSTLEQSGLDAGLVCASPNGLRAQVERASFDLCFLDERAPAERARELPTILLTDSDDSDGALAGNPGVADVLGIDALDGRTLARAVRHALETERLRSALRDQEQLVEHERERIARLIDSLPVVVWESEYDAEGELRQTYVTDYIERLTGYTAQEWLAESSLWEGLVHPEDLSMVGVDEEELADTGEARRIYRIVRKDGGIAWIDVRFSLLYRSDGSPLGFRGIALDVTEQKLAEERLERSEKLFESFMDHSPFLNFIKDASGRYVFANAALARTVGRSADEIHGRTDHQVWKVDTATDFIRNDQEVLEADRALEFTEITHEGTEEIVSHVVKFPIHAADGTTMLGGIAVDITRRIRAEEESRKNEERFFLLARASNDLVYDWDLKSDQIWWNENLEERFGYPRTEGGYHIEWWRRHVHPDDRDVVTASLERALRVHERRWEAEYRFRRHDGDYANILERGYLVYDESGAPARMIGAMHDLTDRIRSAEEVRRREEEYRRIVETAQEGIWVTDNRGVTTFVNATMARLLGHTVEKMMGTKFEVYLDEAARQFARGNKERRARGLAEKYDLRMLRADGSTIWTIVSANPIVDDSGALVGSLAMVTDITDRKRADEALRASEEKFRRIVETAQEGIWMIDEQARTTFVNARMAELLGRTVLEVIGRPAIEMWPESHAELMRSRFDHRRNGISEHYEVELVRPNGERIWTMVSGNPVLRDDGSYAGSLAMFTDITGRRQAELALRDANDQLEVRVQERTAELAAAMHQLEQAHRAQRRFVADASHDLRTPLTVVRAELDLLLGSGMSDLPIGDSLRRALSEVHRLDTLATDLLTLATLDNDDSTSARERVRLDEMLLDSISNLTTVARDKQIAWNIEIEDAIELECHRASLQRAIGNVLDNALKFSPVGEVITVRFARTDGRACIVVSDCGIGIAPEELPRIYDRFYRSDAARHTQGTGLGLPIVKRVVEAHGGEVVVESEQGRGTTVTIALPVDRSSDA